MSLRETVVAIRYGNEGPASMVQITVEYQQAGEKWLAECLELGTATEALSLDDVRREISEAIVLQLNEVDQLGFIEEFLSQHGTRWIPFSAPSPHEHPHAPTWNLPVAAGA